VPPKPMRRGAKLALMRRPAFADAMAMVEALAPVLGGEFATVKSAWAETIPAHGDPHERETAEPVSAHASDDAAAPPDGGRGKRRRGRRGGRGRRKNRAVDTVMAPAAPGMTAPSPAALQAPPAAVPATRGPKLPPVWDDNYFFAALPSVPETADQDDDGDSGRYASGVVEVTDQPGDPKPSPNGRKRRRGGRRHRGGGPIIPPAGSSSST